MSLPLFSIIIPTCDRPQLLNQTLSAALNVSHGSYEVVVSDNFSGPETREVVERLRHPRLRYVRTDRRLHMPDSWQFAYEHAKGEYLIILGDDDGIVTNALTKLHQIISATGVELMTWRNFGYYHPDWPSQMRNTVMLGRLTKHVSLIAAAYMLRKSNTLEHPALFEFPHGSRFCFSRRLGDAVTSRCGRVFDVPYPDFTSSLYMLATMADNYYAYYDGPVSFTTYSYNSNSAIVLSRRKRNTKRAESFFSEFAESLYRYAPLKSHLIWNGHAECVLRMRAHFQLPPELGQFDFAKYFLMCHTSIVEDDLSDVTRDSDELLQEFRRVLGLQPASVRAQYELLRTQQRRWGFGQLEGGIGRHLARRLPRSVKESVKASKLFRRAAEFVSGNRLAVSGDDHGFSNLTELCTKLEGLVGDDEPFMNVLRPAAEAARD